MNTNSKHHPELGPAQELLAQWQAARRAESGIGPAPLRDSVEVLSKRVAAVDLGDKDRRDILKVARRIASSDAETDAHDDIVQRVLNDVHRVAQEMKIATPAPPAIGAIPIGRVNAEARQVPGCPGEIAIGIDVGLIFVCFLGSKILARCLYYDLQDNENGALLRMSRETAVQAVDHDELLRIRLSELVIAYLFTGAPHNATQYFDLERAHLASILMSGAEAFAVAHEYGHLTLRHIGRPPAEAMTWDSDDELARTTWRCT